MDRDIARQLIEYFKELDLIWNKIYELTLNMSESDGRRIRRIGGNCAVDMYTEVEMELLKEYPELNRDKQ